MVSRLTQQTTPDTTEPCDKSATTLPYIWALGSGWAVMHLEICAFRVLQFNFGTLQKITGVLLALIMIALAIGYYLGGYLSKLYPARMLTVPWALVLACIFITLTNTILSESILITTTAVPHRLLGATFAVGAMYVVPMICLAMTTPFLVRRLTVAGQSGEAAGKLMGLSTLGSIAGTLIASLYCLPRWGLTYTVASCAWALILLAATGLSVPTRKHERWLFAGSLLLAIVLQLVPAQVMSPKGLLQSIHSEYSHLLTFRHEDRKGQPIYLLADNRHGVQSAFYPANPFRSHYTLSFLIPAILANAQQSLLIGTGLGEFVYAMQTAKPEAQITAVDIDPIITALAKDHCAAVNVNADRATFATDDGRLFLRDTKQTWDFIAIDVFHGERRPAHFLTYEFFKLAADKLSSDGILLMNLALPQLHSLGIEACVDQALTHITASLRAAGFTEIGQSTLDDMGFILALKPNLTLSELRSRAHQYAENSEHPYELRMGALLTTFFSTRSVNEPDARMFTDDWIDDMLLDSASENDSLVALSNASNTLQWAQLERRNPTLKLLAAKHFLAAGKLGFNLHTYMATSHSIDFCRDALRWVVNASDPLEELRQNWPFSPPKHCAEFTFETNMNPRLIALQSLWRGLSLAEEGHSDETTQNTALNHLLHAAKALSL